MNETLECPKCGTINEEDERVADAYTCDNCGCNYDMAYCENCSTYVGVVLGHSDCPYCGEELE